jgi:type 1 fimbriae regulatory protein FimB/type 1 fimbriae regulatory protein FimE
VDPGKPSTSSIDPSTAARRTGSSVATTFHLAVETVSVMIISVDSSHEGKAMIRPARATDAPATPTVSVHRKYLTETEVDRLMVAAGRNRWGHRDRTMILLAYRHGFRAGELVDLEWHQVELDAARLHVRRLKNGTPSVHPLRGDELRALRRLRREQESKGTFVFVSERDAPMTSKAFHSTMRRLGESAGLPFPVHPHMLRHACGYALANRGVDTRSLQAWLGHRNIQHTVRYTELSADRFRDFWRE